MENRNGKKKKDCEQVSKAYSRINEEMKNNPQIPVLAEQTRTDFIEYMNKWDGITDIPERFLWGQGPDAISSIGAGVAWKINFFEFMKDEKTKEIIRTLVALHKNNDINYKLIKSIHEVDLLDYVERYPFSGGNRPQICVRRFLNMLFPELFTTIVDEAHLKNTAKKLDFQSYQTLSYVHLQYLIKDKVQDCLKLLQIQVEGVFMNNAIAFWIAR
jgi:hypothetical protein